MALTLLTDTCSSCGIRLNELGATAFPCPSCLDQAIGRCSQCRDQSVAYECPSCGWMGP